MNFIEPRPLADPDAAARKLMELANAFDPVQNGRIYIEKINGPFIYQLKAHPRSTRLVLIWRWPKAGYGCTRAGPM